MTFPTTFANLTSGGEPASLLDAMFNILGASAPIPCTASGTNTITLAPITNFYQPATYSNYQPVSFVAANNATGAVTIRLGALAFVNLYMPSGLQANSGDINAGGFYIAAFNSALNAGGGGFQVFNASTPSVVQPVVGTFKNLKITNGGTPTTQVAVTADQVMLGTSGGGSARVSSVNLTISTGSSGANGLDTGTIVQNTFYSVWVIYNGTTVAGLLSLSATSPTLPSGYIYFARVGWVRTAAASTNLMTTLQFGRQAQYVVTGSQALPFIANGVGTAWTPYTVSNVVVPTTASKISVSASVGIVTASSGNFDLIVAPNNNYGVSAGTSPYPLVAMQIISNAIGTFIFNNVVEFMLESSSIYAGATASGNLTPNLMCLGWEDNI